MKLTKKDFEIILENYNIGKYKTSRHLWWAFGNTIIILRTTKGKYVLKLLHTKSLKNIKLQVNLIYNLRKRGLPLPKIFKTSANNLLHKYENSYITIQKFVEGKHTYSFTPKLVKNCAKTLAELDKQLIKIKTKSKFGFKPNHQFTDKNFKIKRIGYFSLAKEAKEVKTNLKKVSKNKLKKGFIHGDFHGVNIISKNDKVTAILDFDDSHYDYIIEEIAVFLGHSFVHKDKVYKDFIKLFMKEYQKSIKLNKDEKKAIYYFIRQRFLASLDWTEKHKRRLRDRVKIENVNKNLKNSIKSYENLKRISEEEFLSLL